jgi:hypothetical protein
MVRYNNYMILSYNKDDIIYKAVFIYLYAIEVFQSFVVEHGLYN